MEEISKKEEEFQILFQMLDENIFEYVSAYFMIAFYTTNLSTIFLSNKKEKDGLHLCPSVGRKDAALI